MPRFNLGDRVEVIGDVARYYSSKIGIITTSVHPDSVVPKEFIVRLADGRQAAFFDFQLWVPIAVHAHVAFDSAVSSFPPEFRGRTTDRHLRFISENRDIHLKFTGSEGHKRILGQLIAGGAVPEPSLVTLLVQDTPRATTTTDSLGEFTLDEVPAGHVSVEILVPSWRIIAAFEV